MDSKGHTFASRTGNKSYEFYPEEIQVALRGAYRTIQRGGPPQQIEYDITGGLVFNAMLVSVEEKPCWQNTMNESNNDDDGDVPFIGTQWNAHKATHQPPDACEICFLMFFCGD